MKNLVSKVKNFAKNNYAKVGVMLSVGVASSGAFALEDGNIFKPMIDSIDVAPVKSGILSAAGIMIGISVLVMAIIKIKSMISR